VRGESLGWGLGERGRKRDIGGEDYLGEIHSRTLPLSRLSKKGQSVGRFEGEMYSGCKER